MNVTLPRNHLLGVGLSFHFHGYGVEARTIVGPMPSLGAGPGFQDRMAFRSGFWIDAFLILCSWHICTKYLSNLSYVLVYLIKLMMVVSQLAAGLKPHPINKHQVPSDLQTITKTCTS